MFCFDQLSDLVLDQTTVPVTEPVVEPAAEPAAEPVAEPVVESAPAPEPLPAKPMVSIPEAAAIGTEKVFGFCQGILIFSPSLISRSEILLVLRMVSVPMSPTL